MLGQIGGSIIIKLWGFRYKQPKFWGTPRNHLLALVMKDSPKVVRQRIGFAHEEKSGMSDIP